MPDEGEHYTTRTVIVKHKRDESKVKRYVVNPIKKIATWEVDDGKKARVEA